MAEATLTSNVRIAKFCEVTGYTQKAIRRKIEEGLWMEGYEYHRSANGELTVHIPGYERWAKGLPRIATNDEAKAT